jgi:hypothetical protein
LKGVVTIFPLACNEDDDHLRGGLWVGFKAIKASRDMCYLKWKVFVKIIGFTRVYTTKYYSFVKSFMYNFLCPKYPFLNLLF